MKEDREKFQKLITHVFKKKYPFIKDIEVYKMKEFFNELDINLNIIMDIDFFEEHLDINCYDQMDEIYFDLYSFNYCSDVKIDSNKMRSDLLMLYITIMNPKQTLYKVNPVIAIIADY